MKREGKEYESKGRYMTEGYKEMLKQNMEFEAIDKEKEQWNMTHSAANKNDMTSFYRRMYNQEMTFGGPRGPIIEETPQNKIEIQLGINSDDSENEGYKSEQVTKEQVEPLIEKSNKTQLISKEEYLKERSRSASKEKQKRTKTEEEKTDEPEKPEKTEVPLSREEKIRLAKERQKQRAAQINHEPTQ